MLGLAMILQAAIFLAAAFYRKKFLNFIMESVQEGASKYHEKATERIIQANAALARRLGLTDMISDWWIARHNRGAGGGPPDEDHKDAALGGVWEQMPPPPPRPSNAKQLPPGGPPTIDIEPEPEAWEGQPPQGYPFKELGNGHEETGFIMVNKDSAPGTGLDTAAAVPRGVNAAKKATINVAGGSTTAAAAAGGMAGKAAAGPPAALVVDMAVSAGKRVKEGIQGEAQAVASPAAGQPARVAGVRLEGGREAGNLPPAAGAGAIAPEQGQALGTAKQAPEPARLDPRPVVANREAPTASGEMWRSGATVTGTAGTSGTRREPAIPAQPVPPGGQEGPASQAIYRSQEPFAAKPAAASHKSDGGPPHHSGMPVANKKQQER
ncbi:hypothetical protein [Moorella sp. Hama-1]|uniref:hypothetical protein n=1 Tax=Moorella sp. Hama-1 TaxID=2138101 RepID=UPI000D641AF9|nr:hypothetical protein [Moorella sp. Hama-1]BCV20361.1 hypothetical protein hamaS1_04300 [Moorella sp. Hama-1]